MRKNFFKDDLRTISLILLITSVVSIAAIGIYSGMTTADALTEAAESRAMSHLESADYIMIEKTKNIQRFTDILNADFRLRQLLDEQKTDEVQNILRQTAVDFEEIEGCIITDSSGHAYIYNLPFMTEASLLQMQVNCPRISEKNGQLKWYNTGQTEILTSVFKGFVLCGTSIYSDHPATVYLFVKRDIFSGVFATSQKDAVISVLDDSGNLIAASNNEKFASAFSGNMRNIMRLYEEPRGIFFISSSGEDYVGVHHYSAATGFKFLEIYPENTFYGEKLKITVFMIAIILAFLCILGAVYCLLYKRFIKPIRELSAVMSSFDDNTLDRHINVRGNNEVSRLASGFNSMIDRINEIIENIRQKEEAQKKAELLALRSQIKPHFIYNTINSIKILALYNQQPGIAKSLQILARLIRSAFKAAETASPLSCEIDFVKDYIELMQMCYDNKLDTDINISKETEDCMIPVMLLQPIVENAVSHGLAVKLAEGTEPAKLYINAVPSDGKLLIEVTDNGCGIKEEDIDKILNGGENSGGGIGIKNIADRIKLLYGDGFGVSIKSKEGFFTTVSLLLPFEKQDK